MAGVMAKVSRPDGTGSAQPFAQKDTISTRTPVFAYPDELKALAGRDNTAKRAGPAPPSEAPANGHRVSFL